LSIAVGECDEPIIVPVQHTFEPGEKSAVGLTSSSYFAAPATVAHENSGSKTSVSVIRSVTVGEVAVGQVQVKDCTADGTPR
jgi:hypothetical protein